LGVWGWYYQIDIDYLGGKFETDSNRESGFELTIYGADETLEIRRGGDNKRSRGITAGKSLILRQLGEKYAKGSCKAKRGNGELGKTPLRDVRSCDKTYETLFLF